MHLRVEDIPTLIAVWYKLWKINPAINISAARQMENHRNRCSRIIKRSAAAFVAGSGLCRCWRSVKFMRGDLANNLMGKSGFRALYAGAAAVHIKTHTNSGTRKLNADFAARPL